MTRKDSSRYHVAFLRILFAAANFKRSGIFSVGAVGKRAHKRMAVAQHLSEREAAKFCCKLLSFEGLGSYDFDYICASLAVDDVPPIQ